MLMYSGSSVGLSYREVVPTFKHKISMHLSFAPSRRLDVISIAEK